MIKKKYFALLVTLLLVFVLGYCTTSLGYSWDELLDFAEQVSLDTSATVRQRSLANMLLDHANGITNYVTEQVGNINNIKGIWIFYNGGSNTEVTDRVQIWIWTYVPNLDFSGSGGSGISPTEGKRANYGLQYRNTGAYSNNVSTGSSMSRNMGFGLIETSNTNIIYSGWYLQNRYTPRPQIYFTPNFDEHVNVNSTYTDVNALKYDYTVSQWAIGTTTNFSDLYDYVFELRDSTTFSDVGFVQRFSVQTSGGALYYSYRDNTLYVNSSYIRYNRVYRLLVTKHITSETMEYEEYYYIFLPLNAIISGGVITNSGSGDYTTQDSTNNIINNLTDTEQANDTVDDFFTGDSNSFASNIGYSAIDNPFVAIIRNTLQTITDTLLGSGNQTLQIGFAGNTFTLHSEDFTLPNGSVKTFISVLSNGFFVWIIVKYGFQLYQWINSGRLQNLVNEANGHWYKSLF